MREVAHIGGLRHLITGLLGSKGTEEMKTRKAETNQIMTIREVSEYLRLGESTVYRLANDGKLPGRKIGGGWRFSRQELDRWVAQPPGSGEAILE